LFFINLSQIPDKDLEVRRTGQKVDPVTGITYIKEIYAPEKPPKQVNILRIMVLQKVLGRAW
jgi:adenylate/nucleoside-diphosphate kinase